jgi:hypothetical protein
LLLVGDDPIRQLVLDEKELWIDGCLRVETRIVGIAFPDDLFDWGR